MFSFINTNYVYEYNYYTVNINIIEKQFISFFNSELTANTLHLQVVFNHNPLIDTSINLILNSLFGKEITKKYIHYFKIKKPLNTFKTKKKLKICGSIQIAHRQCFVMLQKLQLNFLYLQKHIYYLFTKTVFISDKTFIINNLLDFVCILQYYTYWSTLVTKIQLILQFNIKNKKNEILYVYPISHNGIDLFN